MPVSYLWQKHVAVFGFTEDGELRERGDVWAMQDAHGGTVY